MVEPLPRSILLFSSRLFYLCCTLTALILKDKTSDEALSGVGGRVDDAVDAQAAVVSAARPYCGIGKHVEPYSDIGLRVVVRVVTQQDIMAEQLPQQEYDRHRGGNDVLQHVPLRGCAPSSALPPSNLRIISFNIGCWIERGDSRRRSPASLWAEAGE